MTDWSRIEYSTLHSIRKTYQCISWGGRSRGFGPTMLKDNDIVEWWYNSQYYTFEDWVAVTACPPEQAVMLKLQYG